MHASRRSARGFSLLEVLVATTALLLAVSALAQLLVATTHATRRARALTEAAVFAQQKMEALVPLAAVDGTLTVPAVDTLASNVEGYCDFLNTAGDLMGGVGAAAPPGAAYVRRWTVAPIADASAATFALQVVVLDARRSGISAQLASVVRQAPGAE